MEAAARRDIPVRAVNFIEKPYEADTVLGAVRSALSAHVVDAKLDSEKAEIRERLIALSPRERRVLDGLVAGQPNKAIAHDLGISARTVEIYRANVMVKMRATNLSQLVRMVLIATRNRSGLIAQFTTLELLLF